MKKLSKFLKRSDPLTWLLFSITVVIVATGCSPEKRNCIGGCVGSPGYAAPGAPRLPNTYSQFSQSVASSESTASSLANHDFELHNAALGGHEVSRATSATYILDGGVNATQ